MIKAPHFIKGYSLKKGSNEEHGLLKRPHRAVLEQLYTTLLISTREQPFSSINALPKGFSNCQLKLASSDGLSIYKVFM